MLLSPRVGPPTHGPRRGRRRRTRGRSSARSSGVPWRPRSASPSGQGRGRAVAPIAVDAKRQRLQRAVAEGTSSRRAWVAFLFTDVQGYAVGGGTGAPPTPQCGTAMTPSCDQRSATVVGASCTPQATASSRSSRRRRGRSPRGPGTGARSPPVAAGSREPVPSSVPACTAPPVDATSIRLSVPCAGGAGPRDGRADQGWSCRTLGQLRRGAARRSLGDGSRQDLAPPTEAARAGCGRTARCGGARRRSGRRRGCPSRPATAAVRRRPVVRPVTGTA